MIIPSYHSILLSCFLLLTSLPSKANTIVVNEPDWPPFFFSSNSSLPGIGRELLDICLAEQNYAVSYISTPIKRTHHYMESGEIDINIYK